ncbi:nitroreductase family protein [Intestinimonas butyriciproducens]|uniref:nitroreductase family protein n=1 Tax=Intestinimonas butyriciproducens TaxID=1297617 RepID=UPI00195CC393|nr:nitroreductase family protein [Intestinimonas butyriciproducens]MBM6974887.1 nitroreductase family protein [Intestinimonas butyriciproducens]
MELDEAVFCRRSVRVYTEQKVPEDVIESIINAGMCAPTACNKQQVRFIYLDGNEHLLKLYRAGAATFIKECKQAILVLYDNRIDNIEYSDHIQSASAVIQNMLLKAYSEGVGTCWVCNLPAKTKVRSLYHIPKYYDPIALITLGYPKNAAKQIPRKYRVSDVLHYNIFDMRQEEKVCAFVNESKILLKRHLRRVYQRLPKIKLFTRIADKFEKKFDN